MLISRADAKARGLKRYFTGKPCKRGHVMERSVTNLNCLGCGKEKEAKWRQENPEASRARFKRWVLRHPDEARALYRRQRLKHADRRRREMSRYRSLHPGKTKEWIKNWRRKNPGKVAEHSSRRKARKLNATPPWVDHEAISAIYWRAAAASEVFGVKMHVDHVVPLQGKNVCGLHVPWNLQLLTANENSAKGNRFDAA